MPLDFPNIVPENNLRLPDALTIKHGPARLLSRFILEGDKAARCKGIEVRLRHDFDELVFLNKQQTALGNWYPLVDMVHPNRTELTPENGFWVSAENRTGEIVATWGARVFDWTETNLAEQARTMWYGRDLGQPCIVTAEAAARISGFAICGAASWVRPGRPARIVFVAQQRGRDVKPRLARGGDGFIELGDPAAIFLVGHRCHRLSDPLDLVVAHPFVAVADEAPARLLFARLDADDDHARQELLAQRQRDDARIEMAERGTPFLA